MSRLTLQVELLFEQILEPVEVEDIAQQFDAHIEQQLENGMLDQYGTVYDYRIEPGYTADDNA